jgi:hypothetical protein
VRRTLAIALLCSGVAFAAAKSKKHQSDDAPIPFEDEKTNNDDDRRQDLPKRSEETPHVAEETEVEQKDREKSLASDDDPNIGLSGEILLGANLVYSSRGSGVDALFVGGLRFTWEWSRTVLTDEFWREIFFADVSWFGSSSKGDGTKQVFDNTNYHTFTIAEAAALPLGRTPFAAFVSVGAGFNYQTSSIYVAGDKSPPTDVSAVRFVFQYGGGIRARIGITSDDKIRISFRIEATRLRRGYMDDTVVGGSLGVTF